MLPYFIFSEAMNDSDEGRLFECDQCELKTFSYNYLRAHQTNKHEYEGRVFKCDQCSKSYSMEWNLRLHKRNTHNPVEVPCKFCNFIGRHKQHLAYHLKTKHKENMNMRVCDKCPFTALTDSALKRHEIRKHMNQFKKCQFPGCTFDTLFDEKMTAHISSVHTNKECKYCGVVIPSKKSWDLFLHNYTNHYSLIKIMCDLCNFSTLSKVQYSIHGFSSHEETIICPFCQETILSTSELRIHLKSRHRKCYDCNKCDFFDARKMYLNIHMKNEHTVETIHNPQKKVFRKNKKESDSKIKKSFVKKVSPKIKLKKRVKHIPKAGRKNPVNEFVTSDATESDTNTPQDHFNEKIENNKSVSDPSPNQTDETEQLLLKLNRNLTAELIFLRDSSTTPDDEKSSVLKSEDADQIETKLIDLKEENNEQTNPACMEFKESSVIKIIDNLETRSQMADIPDESWDNKYYICPYDSCTFMTSTLTDLIITEHFAHDHPDADPLIEIKFIPL